MNIEMKEQNLIQEMIEKIVSEYKPEKIILFGSYAYGYPTDDSDIDLLIIKNTDERPIDRRVSIRRIVADPTRKIPVESIVLTSQELHDRIEIGDQFIREILTKGRILYES